MVIGKPVWLLVHYCICLHWPEWSIC